MKENLKLAISVQSSEFRVQSSEFSYQSSEFKELTNL